MVGPRRIRACCVVCMRRSHRECVVGVRVVCWCAACRPRVCGCCAVGVQCVSETQCLGLMADIGASKYIECSALEEDEEKGEV